MMRVVKPLNFNWFFKPFEQKDHQVTSFEAYQKIDIPHNAVDIPFHYFNETDICGVFSYYKTFDIDHTWQEKHLYLTFEGVAHDATIYINHKEVMRHQGGYVPFTADISPFIKWDRNTQIMMVKVDTHEQSDIPPFGGVVDYLGYGGIYREVSLTICDHAHIKDVFVKAYPNKPSSMDIEVSNDKGMLLLTFYDQENHEILSLNHKIDAYHMTISFDIKDKVLWSLEEPNLYHVDVKLILNDQIKDDYSETFGFREALFKNDGFYLNGQKMKLIGLNRHQSYPYVGYAMPKRAQIDDADFLKYTLGLNIVRTAHYPQSKHFINRCDEIGLMVFEEIPGWQHIGDDNWKKNSLNDLTKMIKRDRNHPSIILWGVRINESPDDDTFYQKTNEIAHTMDPLRQTGGVRNIANSHFFEDVYTYNDFSHQGFNKGLEKKSNITKDVPYLVTEFNGHMFPTKTFDDEAHRIMHAKRHLNVLNEMFDPHNNISGAIGWVMSDYNTHAAFGSGDMVCHHGISDMFRLPKLAQASYQSQQSYTPFMKVLSDMHIGEYPGGQLSEAMVLTNLDYIKLYQNDTYINTFYPDQHTYKNLSHPPVMVDDFIGNRLVDEDHLSLKDSKITKKLFKSVMKHGPHLPFFDKLKFLFIMKKNRLTYDQAVKLFFKYVNGWGKNHPVYRFEGYKDDAHVLTEIKGIHDSFDFVIEHQRKTLIIEDTYDVERFVIKKVNQYHAIFPYAFDPIEINIEGVIELIGPSHIHLSGGMAAFWIKTSDKKGKGVITIKTHNQTIKKEVKVI